jgi:hypothetical protein
MVFWIDQHYASLAFILFSPICLGILIDIDSLYIEYYPHYVLIASPVDIGIGYRAVRNNNKKRIGSTGDN